MPRISNIIQLLLIHNVIRCIDKKMHSKIIGEIINSSRRISRDAEYTLDNPPNGRYDTYSDSRKINVSVRRDRRNEIFDEAERAESSHDRWRLGLYADIGCIDLVRWIVLMYR